MKKFACAAVAAVLAFGCAASASAASLLERIKTVTVMTREEFEAEKLRLNAIETAAPEVYAESINVLVYAADAGGSASVPDGEPARCVPLTEVFKAH